MIKKITFCFILVFSCLCIYNSSNLISTKSEEPPVRNSSAPNHGSCNSDLCHSGTLNSGGGSVSIAFNDGNFIYEAGKTYDMTVNIIDAAAIRYGFQMVAYDKTDVENMIYTSQGEFVSPDNVTVTTTDSDNTEYISHFDIPNSNEGSFSFQWTAPDEDQGDITFYVAGNAANGNGNKGGDNIYTNTLDVSFDNSVGFGSLDETSFLLYPNPSIDHFMIESQSIEAFHQISIVNLNGQIEQTYPYQALNQNNYFKHQLESGIYFVQAETDEGVISQKLIVQ